jgi:hypothetical protein
MWIKPLAVAAFLSLGLVSPHAQVAQSARVVASCGTVAPFPTPSPGSTAGLFMDTTGHLCGSSSGGTFTWPGTAGLGTPGQTPGAATTMPYVNSESQSAPNQTPINCSGTATTTAANAPNLGTNLIHGFTIVSLVTTNNVGINLFGTAVIGTPPTITLNALTPSYTTPAGFGPNTNLNVVASASTGYSCWAW